MTTDVELRDFSEAEPIRVAVISDYI